MIISTQHVWYFVGAFMLITFLFIRMTPLIIRDKISTPYYTDSAFFKTGKFINTDYLCKAKYGGYWIRNYFTKYLPVDTVFPLVYTGMFLCIFQLVDDPTLRKVSDASAITGMCFDYLENLTFSLFLVGKKDTIAIYSSLATAFKSICWGLNLLVSLILGSLATIHFIRFGSIVIIVNPYLLHFF